MRFLLSMLVMLFSSATFAQKPVNWTSDQLVQPAELAARIQSGKNLPKIISVGPAASIPHSTGVGMANDSAHLLAFQKMISSLPKNSEIVIYCGCCPFEHCPNVRPAIAALKAGHFTNYHLLNLSTNLKSDWIDKGYPVVKE